MRTIDRGIIKYHKGRLEDEIKKVKEALKEQKSESGTNYWQEILMHFENKLKIYQRQLIENGKH
jgi:hypothetical protein